MKVSEQIQARREQLGISINELAKRLEVSGQAVRHWESGRSFPGKSKTVALESILGMSIDWTEGVRSKSAKSPISTLVNQGDIDLLLLICRLPPQAKDLIQQFVSMHLTALDGGRKAFSDRVKTGVIAPFKEKKTQATKGEINAKGLPAGRNKATRQGSHSTRRKAA
ncbi:helix-turn-helix transcriptional regulator [Polynucleobacter sp. UK-Kesae-W10]|uniref:helix-turn-helix domain-containing protein n=1 Tax=Polynucleobacter sp. UK-Kesae-W10 TaxID=1819738 RepID=UPI001C0E2260|nr:helix-turn-helix transcriptional regulator [Polynucleobacter sp. UK-Kesae-W10]MBU3577514.1 helix-turn-helix transcriptional regulator [Polynucleobacter sp. UK-Kesae-W10]